MTTSALKGNGFTAYLPQMSAFAAATQAPRAAPIGLGWMLHVEQPERVDELQALGLHTTAQAPVFYAFIGF